MAKGLIMSALKNPEYFSEYRASDEVIVMSPPRRMWGSAKSEDDSSAPYNKLEIIINQQKWKRAIAPTDSVEIGEMSCSDSNYCSVEMKVDAVPASPLEYDWQEFLKNYPIDSRAGITSVTISNVRSIRDQLHSFLNKEINPPNLFPADDLGLEISWNLGDLYISVEVASTPEVFWFALNKKTGESKSDNGAISDGFPPTALKNFLLSNKC